MTTNETDAVGESIRPNVHAIWCSLCDDLADLPCSDEGHPVYPALVVDVEQVRLWDARIRSLEAECVETNTLIGLLRLGCLKHRPDYGEPIFPPYQRYLDARERGPS